MRTAAFAALMLFAATPAMAADPVLGEWLTQAGTGKVRIAPCPGKPDRICGVISWLSPADAKATDQNNPDARLKSRPILGLPMIRDFRSAGPGRWTGGKIYDPNSGRTYDSRLSINPNGTLKVEGCVLMVCQAQTWKRS
jgi:uncharacterized protein (DUF2147 family)